MRQGSDQIVAGGGGRTGWTRVKCKAKCDPSGCPLQRTSRWPQRSQNPAGVSRLRALAGAAASGLSLNALMRSSSMRARKKITICATTDRAVAGRPSCRSAHLASQRKNRVARRNKSQRVRNGFDPGSHSARSPTRKIAALRGGASAAVIAAQRRQIQVVTCVATGQSRKIWDRVSYWPAAVQCGRWHRAVVVASRPRSQRAARAPQGSAACSTRHARNR